MKEKFNFVEFSHDGIVKTLSSQDNTDEKIREAVVTHLEKIMDLSNMPDAPFNNHSPKALYSEKDIEIIRNESYLLGKNEGIDETTKQYEKVVSSLQQSNELIQNLTTKLSGFLPMQEPLDQYVDLISLILEEITFKMAIDLPTNFSKVIKEKLKIIIDSSYNGQKLKIKVNEKKLHMIMDIVNSLNITSQFHNIEVLHDQNIPESDCVIEYDNTKLIYDKSYIANEISEILKQFKQDN